MATCTDNELLEVIHAIKAIRMPKFAKNMSAQDAEMIGAIRAIKSLALSDAESEGEE